MARVQCLVAARMGGNDLLPMPCESSYCWCSFDGAAPVSNLTACRVRRGASGSAWAIVRLDLRIPPQRGQATLDANICRVRVFMTGQIGLHKLVGGETSRTLLHAAEIQEDTVLT